MAKLALKEPLQFTVFQQQKTTDGENLNSRLSQYIVRLQDTGLKKIRKTVEEKKKEQIEEGNEDEDEDDDMIDED